MPPEIRTRRKRTIDRRHLVVAIAAIGLSFVPPAIVDAESPAVRGYVTAVHPPDGFDVNGEHVTAAADTQFGPISSKNPASSGTTRDAVQIGAWVEVFGERDRNTKTVAAKRCSFGMIGTACSPGWE
jgi:hypothetical protein